MGEYFHYDEGTGTHISVRQETDDILMELKLSIDHLKSNIEYWKEKYNEVADEKFKDEEIQKLKNKINKLEESQRFGFMITKDEHEKIKEWKQDWFNRKNGGSTYMGAVGGGFTYKFHPTGIGTFGSVIAPDGEEFKFQDLD